MGKKATSFLLYSLSILITVILAIGTIVMANTDITKSSSVISYFAGLLLPGTILLNVGFFLYWLIRRRWVICLIPLAAVAGCYPYYGAFYQNGNGEKPNPMQKENPSNLRILTYNTGNFLNKDNIRCARTLSDFMNTHQVDIACFQEYSMQGRYKDSIGNVFRSHPYSVSNATIDSIRIAVYSKYPIIESKYLAYPNSTYGCIISTIALCEPATLKQAVEQALLEHRVNPDSLQPLQLPLRDSITSAVTRTLTESAPKITLLNTHLQSTGISTTQAETSRLEKYGANRSRSETAGRMTTRMGESYKMRAGQIDTLCRTIQASPYPVILCGDFNDTPHSYVYNRATSLLLDGFKSGGHGYMFTYKYFKKLLRIDYIFNSKELESVRYFSPETEWSDHNPVISELRISF